MNKKLLFGFMSLAALAACTNDDFESQNGVTEEKSPIQFEVINNNEVTRAEMKGNKIAWSAAAGDLFTLYHGDCTGTSYQNATYKAEMGDGGSAVLTTPSMILAGKAIMTWPVDTVFKQKGTNLVVSVPVVQTNIENSIPYVSDVIDIKDRLSGKKPTEDGYYGIGAYNTEGYARKYPIYMRPMASQLTIKADYAGTDAAFKALATGDDPINPIAVTSIELGNTTTAAAYTTDIKLTYTERAAGSDAKKRWDKAEPNNAWSHEVGFNFTDGLGKVQTLTAKEGCLLDGNQGCKFLILPKSVGDEYSQVVVNTLYGKVVIGAGSSYSKDEKAEAWYRYVSASNKTKVDAALEKIADAAETSGENAGKYKTTANIQNGMTQTFSAIDDNKAPETDKYVAGEQMGGAVTRYVQVLLKYLDMSDLHIQNDKHLYDAVRVWKEIGAKEKDITVYLDGDKDGNFEISQKTIAKINEINAATAAEKRSFKVKPCTDHECKAIVITGCGEIPADLTFIVANGATTVPVALNKGENWKWNSKNVMVDAKATGVSKIINRGTLVSDANATLKIFDNKNAGDDKKDPNQIYSIKFENDGEWNITKGTLNVQFTVTNNGTVNIAKGAQYRQDGTGNDFTNEAETLPERFFLNDPSKTDKQKADFVEKIGVVNNKGVFATVNSADIYNYGLIEHADENAKTYITSQQNGTGFADEWSAANKMGRINLPYSNKDEDNISVSAALSSGFVSVTVSSDDAPTSGNLDASVVGNKVNYVIINGGIKTISAVSTQVKYVEINQPGTETVWNVAEAGYDGLMILSDVNIKLGTKIAATATYIAADMYVGGTFNKDAAVTIGTGKSEKTYKATVWNTYFGNTEKNVATKYITFK